MANRYILLVSDTQNVNLRILHSGESLGEVEAEFVRLRVAELYELSVIVDHTHPCINIIKLCKKDTVTGDWLQQVYEWILIDPDPREMQEQVYE